MIRAFGVEDTLLKTIDEKSTDNLNNALWIDLIDPTDDERSVLKLGLDQTLIEEHELEDIEATARFFEDEDGLHLHSFFYFWDNDDYPSIATVACTIRDGRLFTLRELDLPAFRLYRMRARTTKLLEGSAYELLLDLFSTKIEQLADVIENVYSELENFSRIILEGKPEGKKLNEVLSDLTNLEDISSKVRLCLMDTQRALNFLIRKTKLSELELEQSRDVLRDIESLQPHNESLFQKVSFLMQIAVGYINIEQNKIMKFFSVVSVMFLPAMLIASIYGMNFDNIPTLHSAYGYPMSIAMMLIVSISPYIYFKRKGWL